jgi:glycosyltransferase involved in cell wall biosynthesis
VPLRRPSAVPRPLLVTARTHPRVLLLHNRYRVVGGEERSARLQMHALERAGIAHRMLERHSGDAGKVTAAAALLRGGSDAGAVATAVREFGAGVVHAHNMLPLIGPRGLQAAAAEGAKVVLHLHNVRLFCATGFGERDGGPCIRCRGRNTLPGLRLNCRRSVPEAVAYAAGLSLHQPAVLEAVDRFVTPSTFAADHVAERGLPRDKVEPLRHYLPGEAFARQSLAAEGTYALVCSRISPEKGIDLAVRAATEAGVPLRVAGEGPDRARLEELVRSTRAPVTFLGRVTPEGVRELMAGAAALLMPSRYHEFSPYAALEAMAQGVPVVATAMGGLPELLGEGHCVPPGDADALAARLAALWADPRLRESEGSELLERARERHSEERYVAELLDLYARL